MQNNEEEIIKLLNIKYKSQFDNLELAFLNLSKIFDINYMLELIKKHKDLIISLIKDVVSFFPEFGIADFIFLNGSFSRGTNIFYSDLDLNFMYQEKYRKILLSVELKIYYILAKLLRFKGCDRIHSIMVYIPLVSNEQVFVENNILYPFNLNYFCRENHEKLLYETVNSSRDYKKLIKYFEENIIKGYFYFEWINNYELIIDYKNYDKFLSTLSKVQKNIDKKPILIKTSKKLIENIQKTIKPEFGENMEISYLKKQYKSIPLETLYEALSLLFHNKNISIKFNIENLNKYGIIDNTFYNCIYNYLWCILRIQIILKQFDMDLSSHSSQIINKNNFAEKYSELYNADFEKMTNQVLDDLYYLIILNLEGIS